MPHTARTPMFATTDLCDAHEERLTTGELRVLHPAFRAFGKRARFAGPVATVRCFEDNSMVRAALDVRRGARPRRRRRRQPALRAARRQPGEAACDNGWVGVVVNGCVRDVGEINGHDVGVRALATHPRRSDRRGSGARDQVVEIAGVRVAPGDWCYADDDGILISDHRLDGA